MITRMMNEDSAYEAREAGEGFILEDGMMFARVRVENDEDGYVLVPGGINHMTVDYSKLFSISDLETKTLVYESACSQDEYGFIVEK